MVLIFNFIAASRHRFRRSRDVFLSRDRPYSSSFAEEWDKTNGKRREENHSHLAAWLRTRDFRGVSKAHLGRTFLVLGSSGLYLPISRYVGESGRERSAVCKMPPCSSHVLCSSSLCICAHRIRTMNVASFKGKKVSARREKNGNSYLGERQLKGLVTVT